jgi:repressor LexA
MGKPATLLERLCDHALSLDADSITVEYKDRRDWVSAIKGGTGLSIASYASSGADSKELLRNLYAAAKKPVRTVLRGRRSILKVRVFDDFGEDAFAVTIKPALGLDLCVPPSFTAKQGQYLAFILHYTKIHRVAPSEADMQKYFKVTPPSVHQMVLTLEANGFIERQPGQARSIRLLIPREQLPDLE